MACITENERFISNYRFLLYKLPLRSIQYKIVPPWGEATILPTKQDILKIDLSESIHYQIKTYIWFFYIL
jgi:hypothetical protein